MLSETKSVYEFGPYRLDTAKRLLFRDGKILALQPKTFDLLLLLVESHGRVLTRAQLMSALWPETFVEEANLSFQVSHLRRTLGDGGMDWIETVPKHGYRFNGLVSEIDDQVLAEDGSRSAMMVVGHQQAGADIDRRPEGGVGGAEVHDSLVRSVRSPRRTLWPLLTAAVALASVVPWMLLARKQHPPERAVRFSISPLDEVAVQDRVPSISPDGERLVFIGLTPGGGRQLWIRALDSLRVEPLSGTELVESAFWSPDSKIIAFFADGKLKTIDPDGAPSPQTLCDAPGTSPSGSWSRNGTILFHTRARPQLYKVAKGGGMPVPATSLDGSRQEIAHDAPQFLPDGHHFIYFVQSARPENTGVYVGELGSNRSTLLVNSNVNAAYAESTGAGYLLFAKGTMLVGQNFNPSTMQLVGTPFPVAEHLLRTISAGLERAIFSASANGVLVYRTGVDTGSTELVWFDRHGNRLGRVGEADNYSNPALSPDEKKLAVAVMDSSTGTRNLWVMDLIHQTSARLTFDQVDDTNPVWSPDGMRLAFTTARNGRPRIYQKDVAGTSESRLFLDSGQSMSIQDWSRDGRFLLYIEPSGTWVRSLGEPASKMRLGDGMGKMSSSAEVSPDGRWVAYQLNEPTRSEVYVESLRPNGGKWQVSPAGGMEPHWRPDGKELFYISGQKLMAVEVRGEGGLFEVASPKVLFEVRLENFRRRSRYQVAGNGQKFLINEPVQSSSPFIVAINWTADRRP